MTQTVKTNKPFHPPHVYESDAIYFITACTFDNRPILASDEHKRLFCGLLQEAVRRRPVRLYAWAVLRDHYHLLLLKRTWQHWHLDPGDQWADVTTFE